MAPQGKFRRRFWTIEQGTLMVLGVVVGVLGGYGAVGFRWLINFMRTPSHGSDANLLVVVANLPWWYLLLVPAAGGLVVGLLIYFLAREAKGRGGHRRHLQRPGGGHDVRHGDRAGRLCVAAFRPIVISAVMATALSRFCLSDFPAFVVPSYPLV